MSILIGNAPCSWGTLEFQGVKTERMTHERMLDELVETGYVGSELGDWGFMPTDAETLSEEFRRRRLALTGAFVGVDLKNPAAHDEGEATVVRTARLLAAVAANLAQPVQPFLVLADDNGTDSIRTRYAGRITPEMGMSAEQWRAYAQGANRMARAVEENTGLRTVFHHHCAGHIETPDEIARLLEMTDPESLGLVFDTGHYSFGAGGCESLLSSLDRFGERIWYVHFKDCHPGVLRRSQEEGWDYFESVRQGIFCELGQGCVDFIAVRDWLRDHHYEGFITVEQDVLPGMGSPKESARRNRDFLQSIGL
jgi:inosose dehydratase